MHKHTNTITHSLSCTYARKRGLIYTYTRYSPTHIHNRHEKTCIPPENQSQDPPNPEAYSCQDVAIAFYEVMYVCMYLCMCV